jgi:AraC-like DNA-binding protein
MPTQGPLSKNIFGLGVLASAFDVLVYEQISGPSTMTYDPTFLCRRIESLLELEPRRSLRSITLAIGVDRNTEEKAFRQEHGMSFREFRQRLVLRRALQLLTSSFASVQEISRQLGYQSAQAFSRFVKAGTGKTPLQLRKTPSLSAPAAKSSTNVTEFSTNAN